MDRFLYEWIKDITYYGLEKIGLYYSRYRGFVVDNKDPDNLNRLRINVPEIHGDNVPNQWAWPQSTYAGQGYGVQCIPQTNDLIWVTFEKGNLRRPLWSHGYFAKDEIAEELKGTHLFWFRTPAGITILVDDKKREVHLFEKGKELQPMVLGNTLEEHLKELIDIIKRAKVNTQIGPQGILPIFTQELDTLAEKLEEFKSINGKLS